MITMKEQFPVLRKAINIASIIFVILVVLALSLNILRILFAFATNSVG